MNDAIVNVLAGETIVHTNALATVTRNVLVVREGRRGAQAVIGIESISGMRKVRTTRPELLVIACGLVTVAAASFVSNQGLDVALPIALVACLFVIGYLGTRRAAVLFLTNDESIETVRGSFREATSVIRAVNRTRGIDLLVD